MPPPGAKVIGAPVAVINVKPGGEVWNARDVNVYWPQGGLAVKFTALTNVLFPEVTGDV